MQYLVPAAKEVIKDLNEHQSLLLRKSLTTVVHGSYDSAQTILGAISENEDIEYKVIYPTELDHQWLDTDNVVILNCNHKSSYSSKAKETIKSFVSEGGWLVTSDWMLNIIEDCFPRTISRMSSVSIPDDVVSISPVSHPLTEGVHEGSEFWFDGGSYSIEAIGEVQPLIISEEAKRKYQSELIMVGFQWGEGKVFHTTSHFELQRSKSGGTRMEDAYSAIRLLTNILIHKSYRNEVG